MKRIHLLLLLFIAPVLLYSCQPGSSGGDRKKMPGFTSDNSLEGPMPFQASSPRPDADAFAFHPSNIDMEVGGSLQGFLYIPLPDASSDSLAIALLHSYKLMAMPLLKSWAAQQHQGIAIDLSGQDGAPTQRMDYTLEKEGAFSIPVVIIWDQASAARVDELKSIVAEWPEVTFTSIGH